MNKLSLGLAAVLVASLGLTGCSDGRSATAYCHSREKHLNELSASFTSAADQANEGSASAILQGTLTAAGGIGDFRSMWHDLADVAPEDIRADVEVVRDTIDKEIEAASGSAKDPLGTLASQLVIGVTAYGSASRVDKWTAENCH